MYHFVSMSWVFHHIQTCFDMCKYIIFKNTKSVFISPLAVERDPYLHPSAHSTSQLKGALTSEYSPVKEEKNLLIMIFYEEKNPKACINAIEAYKLIEMMTH